MEKVSNILFSAYTKLLVSNGKKLKDGSVLSSVEVIDLQNSSTSCHPLPDTPIALYGGVGVTSNSIPYICGGSARDWFGPYLRTCFALHNRPVDPWTLGPEMNIPRAFAAATPFMQTSTLGPSLYVAGGIYSEIEVSVTPTNY